MPKCAQKLPTNCFLQRAQVAKKNGRKKIHLRVSKSGSKSKSKSKMSQTVQKKNKVVKICQKVPKGEKRQKSTTTEKCLKVQHYICWPNKVQSRPKIYSEPCVIDLAEQIYKKILLKKLNKT